ncbi:MAG: RrF2 family transcriptional regulator [Novosphingobium sp.]
MAHLTASVEYAIHGLMWLVGSDRPLSARDIAELQGVSPSFLAKIFPKLEKAGLVAASEGVRGGYVLARGPEAISYLDVIDAVEGAKPLFECQDVRAKCAVFAGNPPDWAMRGTCGIHAVMLRAEKAMRDSLASVTLAQTAEGFARKAPASYFAEVDELITERQGGRTRRKREDPDTS